MRRFLLILTLILSLCAAVFVTASMPFTSPWPDARDGVLDLRGADLNTGVYRLDGAWEFYYGRLYTPADLSRGVPEGRELLNVPGGWYHLGYPDSGYATFRLTVRTDWEGELVLFLPEIAEASVLWVNGAELFRAGSVGTAPEASLVSVRNELLAVSPEDGALELVVQASNYHMGGSGLSYPLMIGRDTVLLHHLFLQRTAVAAVLGGLLCIGLYSLFLYSFRRRERLYLTFGLTCFVVVARLALETNSLWQYLWPGGLGPVSSRGFLVLFALHGLCVSRFLMQVFSARLRGAVRVVYWAGFLLPLAGALLCPWNVASALFFLLMAPYLISLVLALRTGKIGRDPYYLLYLCALVAFIIHGPLSKTVLDGELFVPGAAFNLFLVLSQCAILSRDYARARNEAEALNANLEELVERRTAELNAANRRLSDSQTALREMIANVSHDLKTPLTVLSNYLELLGDEAVGTDGRERTEYLGIAYQKNLDLQRLIRNLFEVTRMEGGTAVYHPDWVPAVRVAREAEAKYADQARDQGVVFIARAEEGLELSIDPDKVWTVLDNLVYNALRYTPAGGSVTLELRRAGEKAALTVADTGEGIAAEHLPHIFERFYKASQERKDGSSGLGLYIVETTVEAMGGSISVESKPGQGTSFTALFSARG